MFRVFPCNGNECVLQLDFAIALLEVAEIVWIFACCHKERIKCGVIQFVIEYFAELGQTDVAVSF